MPATPQTLTAGVARKQVESEEITSFYLVPADGGALLSFTPGQYIGLKIDVHGQQERRNYSLSALANPQQYRISVKQAGGRVSNFLHEQIAEGDIL
jgi:nitric oxide dioxygenase